MINYKTYINALRNCAKEHENDITPFAYIRVSDLCRDTANLLETLEQEPRKGHWIMTSDYLTTAYGRVDYVKFKCSCCGEDSLEEGNYCPNCGADMREVEE